MFFTGDQPLLNSYTINLLLNTFTNNNDYIVIPKYKNKVGSPTIFPENSRMNYLIYKEM